MDVSFSLFPYLHCCVKFMSFGNIFWLIWGSFGVHFHLIGRPKAAWDQKLSRKASRSEKCEFPETSPPHCLVPFLTIFPTMCLNYLTFFVFYLHVRFLNDFLWILGPVEEWKSCKTIGGSYKIKVSHIQKKWGSRFNFRVILGVILEPFGSQNQIFSDSVGISFLGQQNYDFRGQNWLWAGPGNST